MVRLSKLMIFLFVIVLSSSYSNAGTYEEMRRGCDPLLLSKKDTIVDEKLRMLNEAKKATCKLEYLRLIKSYEESGAIPLGIPIYDVLIKAYPSESELYYFRGSALQKLPVKNGETYLYIIKDFEKSIELGNKTPDLALKAGLAYANTIRVLTRRYDRKHSPQEKVEMWARKGLSLLNEAIEAVYDGKDENDPFAYYGRAVIYSAIFNWEKSINDYTKAIDLGLVNKGGDSFNDAYVSRGIAYTQIKDYEKGIKDFQYFLNLQTFEKKDNYYYDKLVSLLLGMAYHDIKNYTYSIDAFSKSLSMGVPPETKYKPSATLGQLYRLRGLTYRKAGDICKAVEDFKKAVKEEIPAQEKLSLLNSIAWGLGVQESSCQDPKKSLKYAQEAVELSEYKNHHYLDTLAAIYAELGDFTKAIEIETKALNLAVKNNQSKSADDYRNVLNAYKKKITYY